MAHEIATIEGKAAMAYAGATPWHRLGTPMMGFPNVQDAMEAATLNWTVEKEHMFLKTGQKVPSKYAVVRSVDRKVLACVGSTYKPLQNAEAFEPLNLACKEFGVTIETAGALGRGDRVWMLAKLPNTIEPVSGDKVEGFFLINSGHNGWTPYSARLTPVRVVCANTLSLAMRDKAVIKLRHTHTDLQRMDLVANMVTNLVAALKISGDSFAKLAARKMSESDIDTYIDAVLGIPAFAVVEGVMERKRDTMRTLARKGKGVEYAPMTAWAAYNGVTEYVDHIRTATNERLLRNSDVSALFGPSAKMKQDALAIALEFAKVAA